MRTGAASSVGARRHNENDVTMTIAGLWRSGDWRHVATGCAALVLHACMEASGLMGLLMKTLEQDTGL